MPAPSVRRYEAKVTEVRFFESATHYLSLGDLRDLVDACEDMGEKAEVFIEKTTETATRKGQFFVVGPVTVRESRP